MKLIPGENSLSLDDVPFKLQYKRVLKTFIGSISKFEYSSIKAGYMCGNYIQDGTTYNFQHVPLRNDLNIYTSFDDNKDVEIALIFDSYNVTFSGLRVFFLGKQISDLSFKGVNYTSHEILHLFIRDAYNFLKENK